MSNVCNGSGGGLGCRHLGWRRRINPSARKRTKQKAEKQREVGGKHGGIRGGGDGKKQRRIIREEEENNSQENGEITGNKKKIVAGKVERAEGLVTGGWTATYVLEVYQNQLNIGKKKLKRRKKQENSVGPVGLVAGDGCRPAAAVSVELAAAGKTKSEMIVGFLESWYLRWVTVLRLIEGGRNKEDGSRKGNWRLGFKSEPLHVDDITTNVSTAGRGWVSDGFFNFLFKVGQIILLYRLWRNWGIFTVEGQANFYPP